MLTTIMNKLTRPPAAPSNDEAELLAQITGDNPADLRHQRAQLQARRDANHARWTALGPPRDQGAARERRAIEDQGPELDAQIKVLDARIARAEARQSAVLALTRLHDETDETIAALMSELYPRVLVADQTERRRRLVEIDGYARRRSRLAAALAPVVPSVRRFRRAPDPLRTLVDDLRQRADEIERALGPGMPRGIAAMPRGTAELIDALKGGTA
jgi:hypothetical protein